MTRTPPYLTPRDRVLAEPWIALDGKGGLLGSAPLAWDYNTRLNLSRSINVDYEGVLADCMLDPGDVLNIAVRYWSSHYRTRTVAASVLVDGALTTARVLSVELDGSLLGGGLTIETTVELSNQRSGGEMFSARWPGTILWRDAVNVPLEGDGGLLPVAPVSFAESPRLPTGASWYVSMDFADWGAAAMGSLLVLLNADQPQISHGLGPGSDEDATALLWSALTVDIVCDVLTKALDDPDFGLDDEWEELNTEALTLSGLVRGLIRGFLARATERDGEAFGRLRELRRTDPSMFRAEIQAGVQFMSGTWS